MDRTAYTFIVVGGDRMIFKSEKECIVCKKKVGKSLKRLKKHHCHFCHHAVCKDCSPQKVPHPESSKPERICTLCYQLGVEKHYSDGYSQELQKSLQANDVLMEQISKQSMTTQQAEDWRAELEIKTMKWKEEHDSKMQTNQLRLIEASKAKNNLVEQLNELKEIAERENQKLTEREEQSRQLRSELDTLNDAPDLRDQIKQLKLELSELQDENVRIVRNAESNAKTEAKDDKLVSTHQELTEKVRELETEKEFLNQQIQNYEPEEESEGTDTKVLNEMSQKNQIKIQQLRSALCKQPKKKDKPETLDTIAGKKCKCLLF